MTRASLGRRAGSRRRRSPEVPGRPGPAFPGRARCPGRGCGAGSCRALCGAGGASGEEAAETRGSGRGRQTRHREWQRECDPQGHSLPARERSPPPEVRDTLSRPPCVPGSPAGAGRGGESFGTCPYSGVYPPLSTAEPAPAPARAPGLRAPGRLLPTREDTGRGRLAFSEAETSAAPRRSGR